VQSPVFLLAPLRVSRMYHAMKSRGKKEGISDQEMVKKEIAAREGARGRGGRDGMGAVTTGVVWIAPTRYGTVALEA